MKDVIEAAVKALVLKAHGVGVASHEALQFTQAALNLAHTAQVLKQVN